MPGRGSSTPCVWGDKIFLTSSVDGSTDLVAICLNTAGTELWRKMIGKAANQSRADEGDAASASPSTDGKHVWFVVGSGDVACLDVDGKEVWKVNLQDRYGPFKIQFGMHSTPVLFRGKLYVQLLHDGGQWVICLNSATGKCDWMTYRPSDGRAECLHSYASPFIWSNDKDAYLVTHGNDYTIAHDLKSGKEIWRLGGLNPEGTIQRDASIRRLACVHAGPDRCADRETRAQSLRSSRPRRARSKPAASMSYGDCRKERPTSPVRSSSTDLFTCPASRAVSPAWTPRPVR